MCSASQDGVNTLTGLTFAGTDVVHTAERWDRCVSLNLLDYELASNIHEYIRSFNVTTNDWASRLVT